MNSLFIALMAPQQGGGGGNSMVSTLIFFALIFVIFYFMILRPQQKRQKTHDALMKGIKAGDKVTTSGGIIGIVVTVKERSVSIRSADTKLEVLKSAVSEITERESEPGQSPS